MKNIFFSSVLLWDFDIDEIIEIAHIEQFEGVEFRTEQIWYRDTNPKKIKNLLEQYSIVPLIHAPSWDINIASVNKSIRESSINEIKKSIDLSKEIGSKEITIHPGSYNLSKEFYELHLELIVNGLNEICQYANSKGQTVSIELMEDASKQLIISTNRMNYLLSNLPENASVTIDIAHFDNEQKFDYALKNLYKISKAHISNRTKATYHVPLNEGYLDCSYMIKKLITLDVPLIIEGLNTTSSLELLNKNKQYIKKNFEEDI